MFWKAVWLGGAGSYAHQWMGLGTDSHAWVEHLARLFVCSLGSSQPTPQVPRCVVPLACSAFELHPGVAGLCSLQVFQPGCPVRQGREPHWAVGRTVTRLPCLGQRTDQAPGCGGFSCQVLNQADVPPCGRGAGWGSCWAAAGRTQCANPPPTTARVPVKPHPSHQEPHEVTQEWGLPRSNPRCWRSRMPTRGPRSH